MFTFPSSSPNTCTPGATPGGNEHESINLPSASEGSAKPRLYPLYITRRAVFGVKPAALSETASPTAKTSGTTESVAADSSSGRANVSPGSRRSVESANAGGYAW